MRTEITLGKNDVFEALLEYIKSRTNIETSSACLSVEIRINDPKNGPGEWIRALPTSSISAVTADIRATHVKGADS